MADMKIVIEWNTELVQNLMERVHVNVAVWDISSSKYKGKTAQETSWQYIARECGLEGRPTCMKTKIA